MFSHREPFVDLRLVDAVREILSSIESKQDEQADKIESLTEKVDEALDAERRTLFPEELSAYLKAS